MTNCLLETSSTRKNKISLTDYDYQKDIANRLLLASLSTEDVAVLEEILYSPLQTTVTKLAKNLDLDLSCVLSTLEKLKSSGLFSLDEQSLSIDKEMRKYFELQVQRFDEDFRPDMEFLQSLLKKPPIHVLPTWYSIPRSSDNIFDSLVEKNLKTPLVFQRYIMELNFGEPILHNIIQDVYQSKELEVSAAFIIEKYSITKELFEEYMLHLEFSFVCCLGYKKKEDHWEEVVTPFHEWKEYLLFLKSTETPSLKEAPVVLRRPNDFSFVQDLAILLQEAKKTPIALETLNGLPLPKEPYLKQLLPLFLDLSQDPAVYRPYISHLLTKLSLVRLADLSQGTIRVLDTASDWLEMRLDSQALYLYRHPLNRLVNAGFLSEIYTEKAVREIEKSLIRALNKGWLLFDTFFLGIHAEINEQRAICLKRVGKHWKYSLPCYSEEEKKLIRAIILDWLFEAGLVQTGKIDGQDCFRVTKLGHTLFAR